MPSTAASGAAGDFEQFAAAHARRLLGLAHALTANPHDAWDLTQETLARSGERWSRMQLEEPAAYARTVMVRLNVDRIRRLRRELPMWAPPKSTPVEVVGELDRGWSRHCGPSHLGSAPSWPCGYVEDLDVRAITERMGSRKGRSRASSPAASNGCESTRTTTHRCARPVERHEMTDQQTQQPPDQPIQQAFDRLATALAPPPDLAGHGRATARSPSARPSRRRRWCGLRGRRRCGRRRLAARER